MKYLHYNTLLQLRNGSARKKVVHYQLDKVRKLDTKIINKQGMRHVCNILTKVAKRLTNKHQSLIMMHTNTASD